MRVGQALYGLSHAPTPFGPSFIGHQIEPVICRAGLLSHTNELERMWSWASNPDPEARAGVLSRSLFCVS